MKIMYRLSRLVFIIIFVFLVDFLYIIFIKKPIDRVCFENTVKPAKEKKVNISMNIRLYTLYIIFIKEPSDRVCYENILRNVNEKNEYYDAYQS